MKLSGFLAVLFTMAPGLSLNLTAQRFETAPDTLSVRETAVDPHF